MQKDFPDDLEKENKGQEITLLPMTQDRFPAPAWWFPAAFNCGSRDLMPLLASEGSCMHVVHTQAHISKHKQFLKDKLVFSLPRVTWQGPTNDLW